jgi:Leucine-rich repeat (LRR) protein
MDRVVINCLVLLTLTNWAIGLALCPAGCSCEDDRLLVRCHDGNNLDILPITLNPSTERLIIKFNSIKIIDSSIQFYSELRLLDLSNNQIYLTEDKIFIYQVKLLQLHLNNNKISDINNNTFKGLVKLETLNLRGNFIMELRNGVFATIPNIEYLNLGQNRIANIEPEAFSGLKNLKSLYLDDNILTSIPNYAFKHIPYLAELFIGLNSFNSLENDAFRHLINLAALDLHGSLLTNISSAAFFRLRSLKSLDISMNSMSKIPAVALSTLHRLESLKIGQNDFEIIEEGSLFGLPFLRKLDVSACKSLKHIQPGAFAANPNLETITIASNKLLTDISGVLNGLPNLKSVDLRNNAFETVRESWLPWEKLKSFEVSDNPLYCDCEMKWLHQLLHKSSRANKYEILCSAPSQFTEQRLEDIPDEQIGCTSESSMSTLLGFFLIFCPFAAIIAFKNRNYLRMKCQRKSQFINNDADCSFEQHHIYEEIHSKHNESMMNSNMMNYNNAVNSNIYSFGCPYPLQVQAVTQPIYLPRSIATQQLGTLYSEKIVPLYSTANQNIVNH